MKTAVTGASGRIGNVLVRQLLDHGHEVRVLLHRATKSLEGLPVETLRGNMLDPQDMEKLVAGCDIVFHLAAMVSVHRGMADRLHRINVEGTRGILDAAARQKVRRVVYFSTVHAFREDGPDGMFDETRPLALDAEMPYSRTKAEALRMAIRFAGENDLEVLALCPTSVVGPFDFEPSLSGKMLIDLYRRRIPMLAPGGFDWVDVRDVVAAAVAAMHSGRSGEAYLLSGRYATLREIAGISSGITGVPAPKYTAPGFALQVAAPLAEAVSMLTGMRPAFTRDAVNTLKRGSKHVSCAKACRELGYTARPLETTIGDAYDWFEKHRYL